MSKGKVWLVGAGPGDAGLLTRKGEELLKTADVVVYDALIGLEILCLIPAATPKIYAGKRAGQHSMPQEEINQLLVQEASKGKKVVRLKGGDPFVFGRGGEEIDCLKVHNISFEVVPGITSAIAAPAYAGIPVTHRDYNSSFHVITGHVKTGYESRVDYEALVKLGGTLIFLMGMGNISEIVDQLMANGMNPDTPAAIIENGTHVMQRELTAVLKDLPEEASKGEYKAPAIILIGEVAQLMKDFHWLDDLPLFGKQCIVTRAQDSSTEFANRLREKGAHVIQLPMIDIHPKWENQELFAATLQDLRTNFFAENWIVLSSPHDVQCFFKLFEECDLDIRVLGSRVHWAVVGKKTAKALKHYGIRADLIPEHAYAEELAKLLQKKVGLSSKVYVFKGNLSGSEVYDTMVNCGVPCEELVIYETTLEAECEFADRLYSEVKQPYTYVTFTSASCVEGFVKSVGVERDYSAVQAICIGDKTAQKASDYGMRFWVAEEPSLNSMIKCLESIT